MHNPSKAWIAVPLTVGAMLLASCSMYKDALVANPCDSPLTVVFARDPTTGAPLDLKVVPSESSLFVHGVLSDPEGTGRDSVEYGFGSVDRSLIVDVSGEEPIGVVIPARECP